jgi:phage/plasmid-associated DNA primase
MILGYAGTGKSSWLKVIRELFELENVGILSNNVERQWALSSIYTKLVVLGYEVRKDFKWEQGEFQNCVTHEEVSIMIKHKTAFASPFLAPIYMAGNEMVIIFPHVSDD